MTPLSGPPARIAVIGDSLTTQVRATLLESPNADRFVASFCGADAADFVSGDRRLAGVLDRVRAFDADRVVVALGTNDVLRSSDPVGDAAALDAAVGVPSVWVVPDTGNAVLDGPLDRFAAGLSGSGVRVVRFVPSPGDLEADWIHLTAAGVSHYAALVGSQ